MMVSAGLSFLREVREGICPLDLSVCPLDLSVCPLDLSVCPLDLSVCPLDLSVCPLDLSIWRKLYFFCCGPVVGMSVYGGLPEGGPL
jgi:hypothetical protein